MIKDDEKLNRDLCKVGSRVYYWDADHAWAIGEVEEDDGKHFVVHGSEYSATKTGKLGTSKVPDDKVWPIREDVLNEDVDDLLDLTVLHDATIQRCLFVRYLKDCVYTNIGAIVVALNPWNFKIPWYTDDNMGRYLAEGDVVKGCMPHSWSQAHNTYHDLRRDAENQTILISGESGAGKTEAAKIVMKYLGCVSCLHGEEPAKENARRVAFNINQASPVLEGFGNAKTVRNDNSSRFGKFMKVQFDESGSLVGAFTIKYLLEKSRIVTAANNERVYHAFYLMSKGRDAGKYGITNIEDSHVNSGKCIDIPGVDDAEDYDICINAMRDCGFGSEDIDGIWRVVAGVFHCLRVEFEETDGGDASTITPASMQHTQLAAEQWLCDAPALQTELVQSVMETRDGPVTVQHRVVRALDTRDAVCKALYDEAFGWEVLKINENTDAGGGSFIGLLDIFGFEDFEHNSFEQLCINLANETLQNHYNAFIFTKDMDECRSEGIDVTEVKCPDNGPCLQLMCDKLGVFGLLDDESAIGNGSEEKFLDNVQETWSANPFFEVKKLSKDSFIIHHYAASVTYTVSNWLDKNRDTLKNGIKTLIRTSQHPLIANLLPAPELDTKKVTVGGFFREQLGLLMALINSTNPHWIRCVKPHPAKKPLMVHGITTMAQLESSGVLGTVKIRKAGFPVRPTFVKFAARFKVMVSGPYPAMTSPAAEMAALCQKILDAAGLGKQRAQVGKTRVFLKNEANQFLEAEREKALKDHVICIKRCCYYRISKVVQRTKEWGKAAREIQEEVRDWLSRTSADRAEARRQRHEHQRVQAQQQQDLIDEEERSRQDVECDEHTGFLDMQSDLFENAQALQMKEESDKFAREDLLETTRAEKDTIYHDFFAPLAEWKAALVSALLASLLGDEEVGRWRIIDERDEEWSALIATFDYELGFVQLRTIHTTEVRLRVLLLQLESLQRQELHERRAFLEVFNDSLEMSVAPWLDSLGAVRYWSDHIKKRRERVRDTRTHIQEMNLFEEQRSATVRRPCHREGPERVDPGKVWRGCTGVPDGEHLKKSVDRAPLGRAQRSAATPEPLDGSSSSPHRDCSPLRMRSVTGVIASPPRKGGAKGNKLIARTPCVPDYAGHQQRRREEEGLAVRLGNIGSYTTPQFLTMRKTVIQKFLELKEAGEYPFDGQYTYDNSITNLRTLRLAQDELHDVRAALCDKLAKQLSSKTSFAKRSGVLEQCRVTGKWNAFEVSRWTYSEFQDDPAKWRALKTEVDRVAYCILNYKKAMLRVLANATSIGHTVLADCTEQTAFSEVSSVYEYWARSHAQGLVSTNASPAIRFTAVCKHYGGTQREGVHIPPVHPSPGPGMSMPKTPKQHLEATSPQRI